MADKNNAKEIKQWSEEGFDKKWEGGVLFLHPNRTIAGLMYLYDLLENKINWYEEPGGGLGINVFLVSIHFTRKLDKADLVYLSQCGIGFDEEEERFYI